MGQLQQQEEQEGHQETDSVLLVQMEQEVAGLVVLVEQEEQEAGLPGRELGQEAEEELAHLGQEQVMLVEQVARHLVA